MTPGQARVALGGFLLLAIGVTSNALYLQGAVGSAERPIAPARAEPAQSQPGSAAKVAKPAKTTAPAAKAPERVATTERPAGPPSRPPLPPDEGPQEANAQPKSVQTVKVRMVRVATVGEAPSSEPADTDTVRSVQEQLNRQGYGPVATDGVLGVPTRAAIIGYEQDHGMALTGEASQTLLKDLLFGTPPVGGAPDTLEVRTPHAQTIIRQVQQQLAARGYQPGPLDGRLSAETVAAVRTFETDQGLVPKGRISALVVERLQKGIGAGGRHPVN